MAAGLPGGPIFGYFDRFLGGWTDFDRLQGGTDFGADLRVLGPILVSAEISEEIAIFLQILAILCRFSEISPPAGRETLSAPHPRHVHNQASIDFM